MRLRCSCTLQRVSWTKRTLLSAFAYCCSAALTSAEKPLTAAARRAQLIFIPKNVHSVCMFDFTHCSLFGVQQGEPKIFHTDMD